jgi:hypothetical protein
MVGLRREIAGGNRQRKMGDVMDIQENARDRFHREGTVRPTARRVAARATVLSAVAYRAELEREYGVGIHEHAEGRRALLPWLARSGLLSELEADERRFLETPAGGVVEQAAVDFSWRAEGLGVLTWALGRFELPPYDQVTDLAAALQGAGFLEPVEEPDPRESAVLRPDPEIGRFSTHATIVAWRLRQFRIKRDSEVFQQSTEAFGRGRSGVGEPMDFVAFLRSYPNFKGRWLEDLRLIDGDLAIGETGIAGASPDDVARCASIARERQLAAYWLEGDDVTYSHVNPMTVLSACVE